MSTLANKHVMLVGNSDSQLTILENELKERGVIVHSTICDDFSLDTLPENDIGLLIVSHLHEGKSCDKAFEMMKKSESLAKPIPVLCLVNDTSADIEEVLSNGAADYLTANEDPEVTMQKIEAVFSEDEVFSGGSAIDITPVEVTEASAGTKVYVVEDDPLLRNLLGIKFNKVAFPCEFSPDGKNVLPAIKHFKPNVIILDLMLPGRSGFEVLKEIRAESDLSSIPIIVFSNRDSSEDRMKAKALGAEGFYVKAMTDLSELITTIEEVIK